MMPCELVKYSQRVLTCQFPTNIETRSNVVVLGVDSAGAVTNDSCSEEISHTCVTPACMDLPEFLSIYVPEAQVILKPLTNAKVASACKTEVAWGPATYTKCQQTYNYVQSPPF